MRTVTTGMELKNVMPTTVVLALFGIVFLAHVSAQDANSVPVVDKEQQAKRRPAIYLTVFNNGYSSDKLPADPKDFETLVKTISIEGNFNTVLCKYSPERVEICKKYGVKMIVDLLIPDVHLYKNPAASEALCGKLRDDKTVVAYFLWADQMGKFGAGKTRDIANVHMWDPTHATYCGTYMNGSIGSLAMSDFVSYYDFAWQRGIWKNFPHLLGAWREARKNDNRIGRYIEADPGVAGADNVNRLLFLHNSSIACGGRATMWFIGSTQMDLKTLKLNDFGKDAAKVNAWLKPLWSEIPKLGLPSSIYATPITKDYCDKPVVATNKAAYAPGLEECAFPKEFWLQPVSGEFVMGVSKYNYTDEDAVYFANLNAYAEQDVKLKIGKKAKALIFVREKGEYEELKLNDGMIGFKLEAGGGALVRFQ